MNDTTPETTPAPEPKTLHVELSLEAVDAILSALSLTKAEREDELNDLEGRPWPVELLIVYRDRYEQLDGALSEMYKAIFGSGVDTYREVSKMSEDRYERLNRALADSAPYRRRTDDSVVWTIDKDAAPF